MDNQDVGDAGRQGSRPLVFLIRWLRAFLPFAIILTADPFGCSRIADDYSERILLRLAAPFHGGQWRGEASPPTLGQRKVTVLLIDEPSLKLFGAPDERVTWPPPRNEQIDFILRPVLEKYPAAVLLDWTFHAERLSDQESDKETRQQLEDLMREVAEEQARHPGRQALPPRLFLGSKPLFPSPQPGCALQSVRQADVQAADDVAKSLRHWSAKESGVELITLRAYSGNHYALLPYKVEPSSTASAPQPETCAGAEVDGRFLASPAFAMFAEYCIREGKHEAASASCRILSQAPDQKIELAHQFTAEPSYFGYRGSPQVSTPISLVWPGFRSAIQRDIDARLAAPDKQPEMASDETGLRRPTLAQRLKECQSIGNGFMPSLKLFGVLLWSSVKSSPAEPCEYGVDTISLSDMILLESKGELPDIFRDRYVFIGLDLPSVPDTITTPLYAHVPGVMQHAVALENLITLGGGVLHGSRHHVPLLGAGVGEEELTTFGLGLLFSLAAVFLPAKRWFDGLLLHLRFPLRDLVVLGIALAVTLLCTLGAGLLLSAGLAWAPINWVSIIPAMWWLFDDALNAMEDHAQDRKIAILARWPALEKWWALGIGALIVAVLLTNW
jgi:CHASE2 domain-containing sensor protein